MAMKGFKAAFWGEYRKMIRTRMFLITIALFAFIAGMMGLLVYISQHPDSISSKNLLSAKASVFTGTDWKGYLQLIYQVVSLLGLIGFGFVISWVFGREYSDHTAKDLLALPIPRYSIVMAKVAVSFMWSMILALDIWIFALFSGHLAGIAGFEEVDLYKATNLVAVTAILTFAVSIPVGFFACWGQGFLLPLGYIILTMILTNLIASALPGIAPYFPWALPVLLSGAGGD